VTETKATLEATTTTTTASFQLLSSQPPGQEKTQSRHKVGAASTTSRNLGCGRVLIIISIVVLDINSEFLKEEEVV
jgi:hypothetical protein